jgi:hypothetical protein
MRPPLPAKFEHVAEARSRQYGGPRPFALKDSIRRECRAVAEVFHLVGRQSGAGQKFADALQYAARGVVRRCRQLVIGVGPTRQINGYEIREGHARVDPNPKRLQFALHNKRLED